MPARAWRFKSSHPHSHFWRCRTPGPISPTSCGLDLLGGTDPALGVNSYVTNVDCSGVGYSQRIDLPGEAADFNGFPPSSNYAGDENHQRYLDRAAWLNANPNWHRGTAYPHPGFADGPFYAHDAGIVVLSQAEAMAKYGRIPTLDYVDQYAGQPRHLFEAVGYGLTKSGPKT